MRWRVNSARSSSLKIDSPVMLFLIGNILFDLLEIGFANRKIGITTLPLKISHLVFIFQPQIGHALQFLHPLSLRTFGQNVRAHARDLQCLRLESARTQAFSKFHQFECVIACVCLDRIRMALGSLWKKRDGYRPQRGIEAFLLSPRGESGRNRVAVGMID